MYLSFCQERIKVTATKRQNLFLTDKPLNLETDQSMSLMCLKQKNFGTADFIVGDNEV